MITAQFQIPDELYHTLERIAAEREVSVDTVLRDALEASPSIQTKPDEKGEKPWTLLPAVSMGEPLLPEDQWFDAVYMTED